MEHPDVSRETFITTLREDLAALDIVLPDKVLVLCASFFDLLLAWNRTHNLTRITEPASVATRHFAESLALLTIPHLFSAVSRCADVGSGAGFPGIPLAIARPDLSWTLIEKATKKAAFLSYASASLGLSRIQVLHADAGSVSDRFDLVVSRAVATNRQWTQILERLLTEKGKVVLYLPRSLSLPCEASVKEYRRSLRDRRLNLAVFSSHAPFAG